LLTSAYPEPRPVLPETSTATPPSDLRSASLPADEDVIKFFIGLRLLGDVKAKRLLSYMQVLQQEQEQEQKENP